MGAKLDAPRNGSAPRKTFPPPSTADPGAVRLVARCTDGRVVKGHTYDFSPSALRFRLYPVPEGTVEPGERPVELHLRDLKAVFFVRDFDGDPTYEERKQFLDDDRRWGCRVEVVFADGEVLVGSTVSYDRTRPGFFLFPVDPRSNNRRVFVVGQAVSAIRPVTEPPAADDRGAAGSQPAESGPDDVVTQISANAETLKAHVDALAQENAALRERCARLEREPGVWRAAHARLSQEHGATSQALEALRAAHERLREEHDADARALRALRERYDAWLRDTASLTRHFQALVEDLKSLGDPGAAR